VVACFRAVMGHAEALLDLQQLERGARAGAAAAPGGGPRGAQGAAAAELLGLCRGLLRERLPLPPLAALLEVVADGAAPARRRASAGAGASWCASGWRGWWVRDLVAAHARLGAVRWVRPQPDAEAELLARVLAGEGGLRLALRPGERAAWLAGAARGQWPEPPLVVTTPAARAAIAALVQRSAPHIAVVSTAELRRWTCRCRASRADRRRAGGGPLDLSERTGREPARGKRAAVGVAGGPRVVAGSQRHGWRPIHRLLGLHQDRGAPRAAGRHRRPDAELSNDEVMFITIHQIDELWFKLAIRELVRVRDLFAQEKVQEQSLSSAVRGVRRTALLFEQVARHFALMETMTTRDYLGFRDKLTPASGFQSAQLREIEILMGLKLEERLPLGHDNDYLRALRYPDGRDSPASKRVEARLSDRPTLHEAMGEWLYRTPIQGSTPEQPGTRRGAGVPRALPGGPGGRARATRWGWRSRRRRARPTARAGAALPPGDGQRAPS
jgi:hypothetical protein